MNSTFIEKMLSMSKKYPKKTAVIDRNGKRSCTFEDLLAIAGKVTAELHKRNIQRGSCVAILLPRCTEYLAAELGIWLAGCIALPLSPSYPPERITWITDFCDVQLVIGEEIISEAATVAPGEVQIPDNTDDAYIICTSGSTGKPKAVLHTFQTLDEAASRPVIPDLAMEGWSYATTAPFTFALFMYIWCFLANGNIIHILSEDTVLSTEALEEYLDKNPVNVATINPSVLSFFHNRSKTLRYVLGGGEKFTTQYSKDGYELWSGYGQSETAPIACRKLPDHPMERVPLGHCSDTYEYRIIDENGNPVAKGQTGELILKGVMFKCYYKQPELTEKTIVDGWYHTNDLVYENSDGELQYVNRKDWIVKINGLWVDPGEAENAMRAVTGVKDAVVKDFRRSDDSAYLCGYYLADKEIDGLSEILSKKLAAYMIPSFFVRLDDFPKLPNGKLDRKALPEPDASLFRAAYIAPENDLQKKLCDAMAKTLGIEMVGITDGFFTLGGDSIRCMKLINTLREEENIELSVKMVYRYPTVEMLSKELEKETDTSVLRNRLTSGELYPLPYQVYFIDYQLYSPNTILCNNITYLKMDKSKVNPVELKAAVEKVLHHFLNLYSTFEYSENGELVIRCHPELIQDVEIVETVEENIETIHKPAFVKPFEKLIGNLLYKIKIFVTQDSTWLFTDFHHSIMDGSSIAVFVWNVFNCLNGGEPDEDRYGEYLQRMRDELKSSDAEADLSQLKMLYDQNYETYPTPDFLSRENIRKAVDAAFHYPYRCYEEAAEKMHTTINGALIAAGLLAISRYNGNSKVAVEWTYSGRDEIWKESLLGLTMTAIPTQIDFDSINNTDALFEEVNRQIALGVRYSTYSYPVRSVSPSKREYMKMVFEYGIDMPDNIPEGTEFEADFDRLKTCMSIIQCIMFPVRADDIPSLRVVGNGAVYKTESIIEIAEMVVEAFEECLFGDMTDNKLNSLYI